MTNSAFVDVGEVLKAQGASVFRLPELVFAFARRFVRAQTGRWPVDLAGHTFIQNLRRGHYELGVESRHQLLRVAAAFDELSASI